MPQATITISGIQPPEQGKKQGKITDQAGNTWNVWADKLNLYQMGMTYDIAYETNEFKGKSYNVIKTVNPALPHAAPGNTQQGYVVPTQQQRVQPVNQTPAYTPSNASKDEQIFILAFAKEEAKKFPAPLTVTEAVTLVNTWRQAWRFTLGKQAGGEGEYPN